MKRQTQKSDGFTIVELLIVIVVIAILAAITIVAYNGIQVRARESKIRSDISAVQRQVEAYNAQNGNYPITVTGSWNPDWGTQTARPDANCWETQQYSDWVPGIANLPQSDNNSSFTSGEKGCYIYISDGKNYVISAWGMMQSDMTNQPGYSIQGFREMNPGTNRSPFYLCNYGDFTGSDPTKAYYKHSYTLTNMGQTCAS